MCTELNLVSKAEFDRVGKKSILCTIIIVYNISVYYFTTMSNDFTTNWEYMCTVCDRSQKEVGSQKEVIYKQTNFSAPFIYSRILSGPTTHKNWQNLLLLPLSTVVMMMMMVVVGTCAILLISRSTRSTQKYPKII